MALVLPLLVTLLLGLVCYGQYFLIAHSVQQIANDAARATIGGLTSDERSRLAVDAADAAAAINPEIDVRSEEHTSELQSLMRISYAVFCLKKKHSRYNNTKHSQTK